MVKSMENKNKKKVILISMVILLLLVIVVGTSYALYRVSLTSTKRHRLTAGTLSLQILDTNNNVISTETNSGYELNNSYGLNLTEMYPMTDTQGNNQEGFTFKVKNNGTLNAEYDLYIKILEDSTLDESNIKYSLNLMNRTIQEPEILTEAELETINGEKYYKIDILEKKKGFFVICLK